MKLTQSIREIMLLELKVSELRDEINKVCNVKGKKNSEDELRETIKKLNTKIQELKNNKSEKVWSKCYKNKIQN